MISLKKSLDAIELHERLFRASLDAYLAAIHNLGRHTPPLLHDEALPVRTRLAELRDRLAADPSLERISASRLELEEQLRDYKDRLQGAYLKQRREVQEILGALADAASLLEQQNATYAFNFRNFARNLEAVSRLDNLTEIRRRLAIQIAQMKTAMDEAAREHEESLQQLRRELQAFQSRLEQAEQLASTDSLTGLANRRECERRILARIQAGQQFSIIFLDLDQFKALNDRYGHHVGDQILVLFAQRLREQFRRSDVVARWGGDEFMAVLDCPLEQAAEKAREVTGHVGGWYSVTAAGRPLRVLVRVSAGVTEHQPGESLEQLYTRADQQLYATKAQRVAT